jgi:type IV secretory pathway TrbD component
LFFDDLPIWIWSGTYGEQVIVNGVQTWIVILTWTSSDFGYAIWICCDSET